MVSKNHFDDCYFCIVDAQGFIEIERGGIQTYCLQNVLHNENLRFKSNSHALRTNHVAKFSFKFTEIGIVYQRKWLGE